MSCRSIKKAILAIMILFVCTICIVPMDVYAKEMKEISAEFKTGLFKLTASSDEWNYDDVGPGDTFSYNYSIKNTTKKVVEVKLSEIKNETNSELYKILDAELNEGERTSLAEINSDWVLIQPGKEATFDISVYFPEEADNQYQGKELHAQVVFQGRMAKPAKLGTVKTGDYNNITIWLLVLILSMMMLCMLGRYQKIERKSE